MNPSLFIIKARNAKEHRTRRSIRFAIVDLDKPSSYPSNFICMLPQRVTNGRQDESIFSKIFGKDQIEIAKALLLSALESESDSEIKTEIKQRLRMINSKSSGQSVN